MFRRKQNRCQDGNWGGENRDFEVKNRAESGNFGAAKRRSEFEWLRHCRLSRRYQRMSTVEPRRGTKRHGAACRFAEILCRMLSLRQTASQRRRVIANCIAEPGERARRAVPIPPRRRGKLAASCDGVISQNGSSSLASPASAPPITSAGSQAQRLTIERAITALNVQ